MTSEITEAHLQLPIEQFVQAVYDWLDSYDWSDDAFDHRQLSFETARCLKGHPQLRRNNY